MTGWTSPSTRPATSGCWTGLSKRPERVRRQPLPLETVSVDVPEAALEAYEAALGSVCATVGFFRDQRSGEWRVEGVKPVGVGETELTGALSLAAALSGASATLRRVATPAE